ncbi:Stf0 family sulfotransferase [Stella sp.]|uniref:Stf0 family sulfotransferase n=1 Tax=Stella sp. TaxID=2912054 RepID=UPI0035B2ED06
MASDPVERPPPAGGRTAGVNPIVAPEYDFPLFADRPRPYVIAESPRSGSQLLADLLWRTGRMGSPGEYLNAQYTIPALLQRFGVGPLEAPGGMEAYLRALARHRTSPNGVFGLKTHFIQLRPHVEDRSVRRLLRRSRFVWLRRRDVLGQAISYLVALRSGRWRQLRGAARRPHHSEFSARTIDRAIATVAGDDRLWEVAFDANGVTPLVVWYEDLVADPDPPCRAICAMMGVEPPQPFRLADSPLERQADPVKAEWRARFRDQLGWVRPDPTPASRAEPAAPASAPASAPPSPDRPPR